MNCEKRGPAAVAWLTGTAHRFYEDRFRMLSSEIPLVRRQNRGEIFAVCDGIGGAPKGRDAAQELTDSLVRFYQEPDTFSASSSGLHQLLMHANMAIYHWGMVPDTDRPLGGCAGTVVWLNEQNLFVFHAGDTVALLIRDGKASQLTMVHESGKIMIRYFGFGPKLQMQIGCFPLEEFDRILLISDGVTKVYHPLEAATIVEKHDDICHGATDLARRSRSRGSQDDITVMLIEVEEL